MSLQMTFIMQVFFQLAAECLDFQVRFKPESVRFCIKRDFQNQIASNELLPIADGQLTAKSVLVILLVILLVLLLVSLAISIDITG